MLVLALTSFSPPEAALIASFPWPALICSSQARESYCQAGRHMLSPCLAISRSQGRRSFNSSKPQAFWWRAGFHVCAFTGVVSVLSVAMSCLPLGLQALKPTANIFNLDFGRERFSILGKLMDLALFFLDFSFTWNTQLVCTCVCIGFPTCSFVSHTMMT